MESLVEYLTSDFYSSQDGFSEVSSDTSSISTISCDVGYESSESPQEYIIYYNYDLEGIPNINVVLKDQDNLKFKRERNAKYSQKYRLKKKRRNEKLFKKSEKLMKRKLRLENKYQKMMKTIRELQQITSYCTELYDF
ncbi:hypothetical protein PVAND_010023 [Polypedilum vanderplanki]|uniref:BZIP domain-containing protein n=1 Tax=Polypedilum vanderplanki TaxID=319348 RepID=A0A9J6CEK1_POLVA|nr:hypothetical protein PVAND_010023 [Polypedilum vanderplanki]